MSISADYSRLARVTNHIQNPNKTTGTLLIEVPSDIGRSVEGYKRGGILEGAEKFRKEIMAAIVWLLGIPAFKWVGDKVCENLLKIPMDIDFCKAKEGNDTIRESIEFLAFGKNNSGKDATGLAKKYGKKFKITDENILKNKEDYIKNMVKKIGSAKKITSVLAIALNCAMMGIVLPKWNQKITSKKLKEMQSKEKDGNKTITKFESFDEFQKKTKTSLEEKELPKEMSFQGRIPKNLEDLVYNVENDNVFRLIITDIPMIIGRILTSRNKYEALEYLIMDGSGIYLYNFAQGHVEKLLRNLRKKSPIPAIDAKIAEDISRQSPETMQKALSRINENKKTVAEIFEDETLQKTIYKNGTYGKYGQINRFVKDSDLKAIDESVIKYIKYLEEQTKGSFDGAKIKEVVKKVNKTNAKYMLAGFGVSSVGLAVIIPKLTFWITKKLTGRNEFTGIADYSNEKKE